MENFFGKLLEIITCTYLVNCLCCSWLFNPWTAASKSGCVQLQPTAYRALLMEILENGDP